jgi:hypothetical protein
MDKIIIINPDSKNEKIIEKNEDLTCIVEIKYSGVYEGIIKEMTSSGKYTVELIKNIKDR